MQALNAWLVGHDHGLLLQGEVVARGEDLIAGADPEARVGEFGGAAGGGAYVVEVELEQPRLLVRGGQSDGQRVEGLVAGRRRLGDISVGHLVAGRFRIGGCHESDQDVLGVDDQVAHQVPHEPAGTAGRLCEVFVREFADRLA